MLLTPWWWLALPAAAVSRLLIPPPVIMFHMTHSDVYILCCLQFLKFGTFFAAYITNMMYCHQYTVAMYRYFLTVNSHCLKLVSDSSRNNKHNEESSHLAADICCCSVWLWQWTLQEEHLEKNDESESLGVRICLLIKHTRTMFQHADRIL